MSESFVELIVFLVVVAAIILKRVIVTYSIFNYDDGKKVWDEISRDNMESYDENDS